MFLLTYYHCRNWIYGVSGISRQPGKGHAVNIEFFFLLQNKVHNFLGKVTKFEHRLWGRFSKIQRFKGRGRTNRPPPGRIRVKARGGSRTSDQMNYVNIQLANMKCAP